MKKTFKKLVGILMAIVFLLSAAGINQSSAQEQGTITVTGATAGKSYSIYKILDLTYQGTSVSYTISDEWKGFFNSGEGQAFISDNNTSGRLNPIVVDGKTKYINITDENIADFAKKAMAQISKAGINKTQTKKADGEEVKFTNIPLGYYMVHPEGATESAKEANSIISLTSTVPNAEVKVKGVYPTVEKKADKKSADYGEDINYTIKSTVPDTTGFEKFTYKVTDTLSSGLDLKAGSVKVFVDGQDITSDEGTVVNTQKERTLEVSINMMKYQNKVGKEVKITYTASLNQNAVIGNTGNENNVELAYSNDPKDSESTEKTTGKEKVHTAAIKVIKYEKGNEGKKLKGAEFVLKNSDKHYYKLDNGKVTWVDSIDNADKKVTDSEGNVEFKGLKNGTYYLEETKAPDGYNKLTEDKTLEVDYNNQTVTEYLEAKVENSTGIQLPGTGGIGTTMFALAGGAIIMYTAISLIREKFRSERR